jgi:hypothetical protein
MEPHSLKIAMTTSKSSFNHQVESCLVQCSTADGVVDPAESDGGLLGLAAKRTVKRALNDRR